MLQFWAYARATLRPRMVSGAQGAGHQLFAHLDIYTGIASHAASSMACGELWRYLVLGRPKERARTSRMYWRSRRVEIERQLS